MKITLSGSLGHISQPLARILIQEGHTVTLISSKAGNRPAIEALGANPAIGSIEDSKFLRSVFAGADIVYCMEPPVDFFDPELDFLDYYNRVGRSYTKAIEQAGVQHVVHLSSIGGHMEKGNGLLAFHHQVEKLFQALPPPIAITTMRPVGFYYNLFAFIPMIRENGVIAANYGNMREPWVSPLDIADAIAEEMALPFTGRKIRYVASEELTGAEVAAILGAAIGKPGLKWILVPDEEVQKSLEAAGMNPAIVKGLVEMNASRNKGSLYEDYLRNRPLLGKVKLEDFAKDFAALYNRQ